MKKIINLLCVSLLLLVGCAENVTLEGTPVSEPFFASVEGATRTYADENGKLLWSANDQITVFKGTTYPLAYQFTGSTGDNYGGFNPVTTSLGEFETSNTLSANYAVYPYAENTTISNTGVIKYTIPATQTYAKNSFGKGANVMVAVTENKDDKYLAFKNVGGYFEFSLYGDDVTVKSIVFSGNNNEKLAGDVTITATHSGAPTIAFADDATTTLMLDCGSGVALGADAEHATKFWFVVPAMTYEKGITITITDTNGEVMEKSTSKSITIERSTVQPLATFEVLDNKYTLLGTGLFREDIMTTFFSVENVEYEVKIYENIITPGYIYLKNVYTSLYPYNEPGDYVTEDHYLAIDISDPNEVVIPRQKIGLNWGYGDVEIATAMPGIYKDGIITFPAKGLVICMPDYSSSFYYSNDNGLFRVVMPGVVLHDYSLSLIADGMKVVDGEAYPVVDATFGADVAQIQYAVVPENVQYDGEAIAEVLAGIADGSIASATVDAVDQVVDEDEEEETFQMELVGAEAVEAGIYTMVAVPLSADGEVIYDDTAAVAFYVNSVSEATESLDFKMFTMSLNTLCAELGLEADYPESSTMAWLATGSNISTWKQLVADYETVAAMVEEGATLKQIVLTYGSDWDLTYINSDGFDYYYYEELAPETEYIIINYVEDLYGNKKTTAAYYTTAPEEEEVVAKARRKNVEFTSGVAVKSNLLE